MAALDSDSDDCRRRFGGLRGLYSCGRCKQPEVFLQTLPTPCGGSDQSRFVLYGTRLSYSMRRGGYHVPRYGALFHQHASVRFNGWHDRGFASRCDQKRSCFDGGSENYDARAELSWAAVLSQCDLLNTGRESDWSCHNIEHTLAEFYHKPHGAGLAITTPAWMKFVYRHDVDRFVQFAVRVWGIAEDSGTPEDIALKGIKALKDFFKSLGLDVCLKDLGAGDENCKAMAQACFKKYGTLGHFVKLNEPDLYQIYLNMVE